MKQPEHIGLRAHTNLKMFVPAAGMDNARPPSFSGEASAQASGPPMQGYFYETPASLACVYKLVSPLVRRLQSQHVTANPTGGARAIAIVDAYHYPTALHDLVHSRPSSGCRPTSANLQVVYANGRQPQVNADWNIEAASGYRVGACHGAQAKIYLVEAASSSFTDLLNAVSVANSLVKSAGGGEVSMSWGGSEFSSETYYDRYFTQTGVVYFASSGDSPG